MDLDRPLRVRQRGLVILGALILLAAAWLAARSPAALEGAYARGLSFHLSRWLSLATGFLPLSVAELGIAGLSVTLLVQLVKATSQVVRRRRSVLNALAAGGLDRKSVV